MLRVPSLSVLAAGAALALALPTGAMALDNHDLVLACMQKTGVKGDYDYSPKSAIPHMKALPGGTAAGAARLNACIEQSIDVYRPAYVGRASAEMDDLTRGRIAVAMANERNAETAPCQIVMVGGAGYACHRPW